MSKVYGHALTVLLTIAAIGVVFAHLLMWPLPFQPW